MILQVATENGARFAAVLENVETYDQIIALRRALEELLTGGMTDPEGVNYVLGFLHDIEPTSHQARKMQELIFSETPAIFADSTEL